NVRVAEEHFLRGSHLRSEAGLVATARGLPHPQDLRQRGRAGADTGSLRGRHSARAQVSAALSRKAKGERRKGKGGTEDRRPSCVALGLFVFDLQHQVSALLPFAFYFRPSAFRLSNLRCVTFGMATVRVSSSPCRLAPTPAKSRSPLPSS